MPQLTVVHTRIFAAFSRVVGVHPTRFRVLFLLHVLGECSPAALMQWTVTDAAALSRMIQDFETQGLVARRPDPLDARSRLVSLTPAGADHTVELLAKRDKFVGDALAGVSTEENEILSSLLLRVEANVSKLAGLPAVGDSMNIDPKRPDQ